jgi:hypothetical protein
MKPIITYGDTLRHRLTTFTSSEESYHSWIDITFGAVFFVLICLNLLQLARSCLFWRHQHAASTASHSSNNSKSSRGSLNQQPEQSEGGGWGEAIRGKHVVITINIMLTIGLMLRLGLTIVLAAVGQKNFEGNASLILFIYFEMPYHIFNIVSYIVLMQWLQLWAILGFTIQMHAARDNFELRETAFSLTQNFGGGGGGFNICCTKKGIQARLLNPCYYMTALYGVSALVGTLLLADTVA